MAITYIAQKSKSPRNRSRVSLFILFTCTVFCVSLRVQNRLKTIRSGFGCDTEEEENVLRAYITYLAVARPVLNQYRTQCMHDVAFRAMLTSSGVTASKLKVDATGVGPMGKDDSFSVAFWLMKTSLKSSVLSMTSLT